MSKLVSIVVPVFNMEKSLESCVQSILVQNYKNIEVILIDDGSTDRSFDVCKKISQYDSRVICEHTENRGSGPARNRGIEISHGDYIYFPDADDYLEPNAIGRLVSATENGVYDLVIFGYRCVAQDKTIISEKKYDEFCNTGEAIRKDYTDYFGMDKRYSIQGALWNKFFSNRIVKENKIEYPALRRHQDEGFISRYMCYCQNARFISDVLYTYYPNTVSLEWKKYPVDYIDAVIGLYNVWTDTICKWNNNEAVRARVEEEYLTKTIKALELSYSPKMQLNVITRISWLRDIALKANIKNIDKKYAGSKYQNLVLTFVKNEMYFLLSILMFIGNIKNYIRQK